MTVPRLSEFTPPAPPPGMEMDEFWQPFMTFVQVIPVLAVLWFGLRKWMPNDRVLFGVLILSGAATSFVEPLTDHVAFVWFAPEGMWEMFTTFGRSMPWFILPCYIWFMTGQVAYLIYRVRTGITARGLWTLYVVFIGTNIAMEIPPLATGIYVYYGAQPFKIAGLPLWFQAINAAVPLVATAVYLDVWPRLSGIARVGAVAIIPCCHAMINAGAGWPMWSALNSTDELWITHLVGLLSIFLALAAAWVAITALLRYSAPSPRLPSDRRTSDGTPQRDVPDVLASRDATPQ